MGDGLALVGSRAPRGMAWRRRRDNASCRAPARRQVPRHSQAPGPPWLNAARRAPEPTPRSVSAVRGMARRPRPLPRYDVASGITRLMRRCRKCGVRKLRTKFYKDKSRRDGVGDNCKTCVAEERAKYRESNREKLRLTAAADRIRVPERGCWHVMISRCHNAKNKAYPQYGAVGIEVCTRWRRSFNAFLRDVGPRPSLKHSLDRYPNQRGNYETGNVRWATRIQQARNMKKNRLLTAFGKTQCVAEWAEELGLPGYVIHGRIHKLGWDTERALSTPVRRAS